jgi:hypothetical protein
LIKTATIESSGRDSKWKEGYCWIRRGNERFKMEGGLLLDLRILIWKRKLSFVVDLSQKRVLKRKQKSPNRRSK